MLGAPMKVTAKPLLRRGEERELWKKPIRHRHEINWTDDGTLRIEFVAPGLDNSNAQYRYTLEIPSGDQQNILTSKYAAETERKVQALEEELRLLKLQQELGF